MGVVRCNEPRARSGLSAAAPVPLRELAFEVGRAIGEGGDPLVLGRCPDFSARIGFDHHASLAMSADVVVMWVPPKGAWPGLQHEVKTHSVGTWFVTVRSCQATGERGRAGEAHRGMAPRLTKSHSLDQGCAAVG